MGLFCLMSLASHVTSPAQHCLTLKLDPEVVKGCNYLKLTGAAVLQKKSYFLKHLTMNLSFLRWAVFSFPHGACIKQTLTWPDAKTFSVHTSKSSATTLLWVLCTQLQLPCSTSATSPGTLLLQGHYAMLVYIIIIMPERLIWELPFWGHL